MRRTTSPNPVTRPLSRALGALAIVGVIALSSCGDDAKTSSTTVTAVGATVAPEDIKVDAATRHCRPDQAARDDRVGDRRDRHPDADTTIDAIEQEWASFEGTVRATDPDIYFAIEDQLDPVQDQIKAGDAAAAADTAATLSDLFGQYMTKYPG